jgi:hypothetical protein
MANFSIITRNFKTKSEQNSRNKAILFRTFGPETLFSQVISMFLRSPCRFPLDRVRKHCRVRAHQEGV